MFEFNGKFIPTTLEEMINPKFSALVVADLQNDYIAKGGAYQKIGRYAVKVYAIIKKLEILIQEARKAGVKIIYIKNKLVNIVL